MAYTFLGSELNPMSKMNKAVMNIIILCTMAWIVSAVLGLSDFGNSLLRYFMLTPDFPDFLYQPFSLISYIFLHDGFMHLLFNMLWLFFVGIILEDLTGKKHIWRLFLGGGIAGGLLFMLAYNIFPSLRGYDVMSSVYMVGASAGVSSVIVATAAFVPKYTVYLFGILRVELVWIAAFRVLFDLLGVAGPHNQGGYISHLGGAAFGLLYMLHIRGVIHIPLVDHVSGIFKRKTKMKVSRPTRTAKVVIQNTTNSNAPSQAEIDRILDKINESGYESLSKVEKEKLFRAGEK